MSTTPTPYTPTDTDTDTEKVLTYIREAYVRPPGIFGHYGAEARGREFDAVIARVRAEALRDAADDWGDGTEGFPYGWLLARAASIEQEAQG